LSYNNSPYRDAAFWAFLLLYPPYSLTSLLLHEWGLDKQHLFQSLLAIHSLAFCGTISHCVCTSILCFCTISSTTHSSRNQNLPFPCICSYCLQETLASFLLSRCLEFHKAQSVHRINATSKRLPRTSKPEILRIHLIRHTAQGPPPLPPPLAVCSPTTLTALALCENHPAEDNEGGEESGTHPRQRRYYRERE
jgi:hypothetical protein